MPVSDAERARDSDWRASLQRLRSDVEAAGPFDVALVAAGGLGMRFGQFAWISLLRVPRVLIYLGLIQVGALGVLG